MLEAIFALLLAGMGSDRYVERERAERVTDWVVSITGHVQPIRKAIQGSDPEVAKRCRRILRRHLNSFCMVRIALVHFPQTYKDVWVEANYQPSIIDTEAYLYTLMDHGVPRHIIAREVARAYANWTRAKMRSVYEYFYPSPYPYPRYCYPWN